MASILEALDTNYIDIHLQDGFKFSLADQTMFIDYFEDIMSQGVTLRMFISSSESIVQGLKIRGGERVAISLKTASGMFERDKEYSFYVYKISGLSTTDTSEYFTMHCVTGASLDNELKRVTKRYDGSIKTSVESILSDVLKLDGTRYDSKNIEQTANNYSFIGNNRNPLTVIQWLAPKSVPTSSASGASGDENGEARGTAGFLFWENSEGYNFKSVSSLVSKADIGIGSADDKSIATYKFSGVMKTNNIENAFQIIKYDVEKNIDLRKALRLGTFSNVTEFFDLYTGGMDTYEYNLQKEMEKFPQLGTEDKIQVDKTFSSTPSRIMVRMSDRGVLDNDGVTTDSGRDNADMAKASARYNILFSQAINITIPLNINLKAGDLINAIFPKIEASNVKKADMDQSGRYLIQQVRHHFEQSQNLSYLRLVRDSYGLYGKN
jgi:hypothetical protein